MSPEQGIDSTGLMALRAIISLVAVLAFIAATGWLLKRFSGGRVALVGGDRPAISLEVLNATGVDARRKLVLVRRDDVAHLLLIGGTSDVVVETGIPLPSSSYETNSDKEVIS